MIRDLPARARRRPDADPRYQEERYLRALRVERRRLAQAEESYLMRATAAVVASQRRRRHR